MSTHEIPAATASALVDTAFARTNTEQRDLAIAHVGGQKTEKPKTWRLFIDPTPWCSLNKDIIRSAIEDEFQIKLGESKLVLALEPDWYCATLSPQDIELPFDNDKRFTIEIAIDDGKIVKLCFTPDTTFLGMTTLYDGTEGEEGAVDIVVVPGLAGHPYGSFRSPTYPAENWLRDYLPLHLPHLRILLYGYDSSIVNRRSKETILDYAPNLLDAVHKYRKAKVTSQRPIVFIGYSLGGLIIKQALVHASTNSKEWHTTFLKSCYGFLFFGVPNRGLRSEKLVKILGYTPQGQLVSDLVVDKNSEAKPLLRILGQNFMTLVPSSHHHIIAFYETIESPTIEKIDGTWKRARKSRLIVTQDSATSINGVNQICDAIAIPADHSMMVKYRTRFDENYRLVEQKIAEVVEDVVKTAKATFSIMNELPQESKERLRGLKQAIRPIATIRDAIPAACKKTLTWFLDEPDFINWRDTDKSPIFWLCGPPGQGKSVLAKFLAVYLEKHRAEYSQKMSIITFFCSAQEQQFHEPIDILRQLILQLIDYKEDYESLSKELWDEFLSASFDRLWEPFETLMLRTHRRRVYLIIDALDECKKGEYHCPKYSSAESQRSKLLGGLITLSSQSKGRLKLLITSRSDKDDIVSHLASYRCDLMARREDLELFTESKLQGLTKFSDELKKTVCEKFRARTDRSFLWHSIVMTELRSLLMPTSYEVERMLNGIPPELDKMYFELVKRLAKQHLKYVKILIWVAYATRPLTISEIEDALTFDHLTKQQRRLSETKRHRFSLDTKLFTEELGSFLSIQSDSNSGYNPCSSSVLFQHQSAKDFFDQNRDSDIFLGVQPDVYLARTCLYYLTSEEFRDRNEFQREAITRRVKLHKNYYQTSSFEERRVVDEYFHPVNISGRYYKPYDKVPEHPKHPKLAKSVYDEQPFTFLQYAGTSWFKHIKSKQQAEAEENNLMIEQILDPSHPFLLVWVSADFLSCEPSKNSFHSQYIDDKLDTNLYSPIRVAIEFKIDWLVERIIEVEPPSKSFDKLQLIKISRSWPKAFEICIKREKQLLLNLPSSFLADMVNRKCPLAMIKTLTDLPNIEPKIIEEALEAMLKKANTYGLEAVKLLLVKAPGIAIGTDTYIQHAIQGGNKHVLEFILNTTPSVAEGVGRFIQYAIQHGNEITLGVLLNQSKNSTITDEYIKAAICRGNKDILRLLLNITSTNMITDNHILYAIEAIYSEDIVDLLLKKASGITITDKHIQLAVRCDKRHITELLLSKNPKIIPNPDHCIRDAIETGKSSALKALLNKISNIAITDSHIRRAIEIKNKFVLEVLLNNTSNGATAGNYIQYAIQSGNLDVIKVLLTKISGAEITLDHIQCAIRSGNEKIVSIIFSRILNSTITDDHLRGVVQTGIGPLLRLLLERSRDNITILSELVDTALTFPDQEKSDIAMKVLLDTCHTESIITEKRLLNAAQRGRLMIIRHFLRKGDQHKEAVTLLVTDKVVTAVLNSSTMRNVNQQDLLVVLVQLRTQIHPSISEKTAEVTVRGLHYWVDSVLSEILKMRAPGSPIGESLVTAAASNESIAGFILGFLLRHDLSAEFTDKAMRALMSNTPQRQPALKVLLNSNASRMKITDTVMLETLIEWPDSFPDFINQPGITFETATRYWRITNRALRQTPLVLENIGAYPDYSSSNQDKLWMAHRCCCERMKILSANLDQGDQPAGQPIISLIGPHEDNVLESLSDEPQFEPGLWAHAYYTAYSIT